MSPRLLRPVASGFNPKSISGLAGWWDPSDTATVTTASGAVSQLNDKSGLGRHATQTVANNRPSYSGTINGRNAMTFNGTTNRLVTGLESNTLTGFATFFCVCRVDSGWSDATANNKTPLYGRDSTTSNAYGINLSNVSGNLALNVQWRGFGFNMINGPTVAKGTPQLLVGSLNTTTRFRRVNGTAANVAMAGTAGTNAAAGNFLAIGEDPTQLRYWSDLIGEILVYDRTLTTDEIKKVESYLGKKYGITVAP
jgi:hypothetical protein